MAAYAIFLVLTPVVAGLDAGRFGWSAVPLPGAVIGPLFILRAAKEDRMLREELPGYPEYAQRVRCRLVPGIW